MSGEQQHFVMGGGRRDKSQRSEERKSQKKEVLAPGEKFQQKGTAHGVRGHNDRADHESETNRLFYLEAQARETLREEKGDTFQGTTRSTLEEDSTHLFPSDHRTRICREITCGRSLHCKNRGMGGTFITYAHCN